MNRLDDLLRGERERAHRLRLEPPAFGEIRARGVRRRARRRAAAVGSVAALAAVVVLGGQAVLDGPSAREPLPPATSPAPDPTAPSRPTPVPPSGTERDAPSPDPTLLTLAVAPEDEDVRASLWWRCAKRCQGGKFELLLTRDGFATSVSVPVPDAEESTITPLGGDAFHMTADDGSFIARTDGTTTAVRPDGDPGPLAEGEVLVRSATWGGRPIGLDPDTGRAHLLATPDVDVDLQIQPDGTMVGWTWSREGRASVVWSVDSGRSWQEKTLPTIGGRDHVTVLPSARPGTLAVVESADMGEDPAGALKPRLTRVHRSTDGGRTWQTIEVEGAPRALVRKGGITADGRLVVDVEEWADGAGPEREAGIHATTEVDWSRFTLMRARPTDVSQDVHVEATARGLVVTAIHDGVGVVDVSRDAGQTWRRLTAR
ncbi:hypothetical protein [Nocardioides jishulii]|uniref:Uncharacterized protein n=1 Tax=Nocardioides jishulii TaxID=2575440 RepID=A0A4U2YSE8_9ACTN|nr:hypothetical protein [Nocardioides jishulii]QCX26311.1 hypothetical protein FCL41_01200 [Nocardioides jishulii]TKI63884.1 hypothetical protein FC770_01505 [Nocardioides jishulii]